MFLVMFLSWICLGISGEELLERTCVGQKCYEVVEKTSSDGSIRLRQLYYKDGRSSRCLLSQGTLRSNHEFEKNEVNDSANRAMIGALFASKSMSNKTFNVLYSTNSPGEIDRYFAQNQQFNATALIFDQPALEISRKWMGIENNGVNYIPDPNVEHLSLLQRSGSFFDAYIIDICDYWKGKRIYPADAVFGSDRMQYFTNLLKPDGVLILRLSSGESSSQMASRRSHRETFPPSFAEMALGELFSTCYKYPEEVRKRGEMQLLICSLLPTPSPWEHLRRSIVWKEAALTLPRFHD